jgi:hypothetical protein
MTQVLQSLQKKNKRYRIYLCSLTILRRRKMKKFMLFAVLFGVFASVLTSCGGSKKEETPIAEVVEEEVVVGEEGENNQENTSAESNEAK